MKIFLLLGTLALLASCTQPSAPAPTPTPVPAPKVMEEAKMMNDESMMKEDAMMTGETMVKDEAMMKKEEGTMMKATGYMAYDEAKVKEALASGQKVALFFHASWCPSCRALDGAINSSLSSIPADALIMKVDYDTSTELKKKYGVTSQHTTVVIDKDMSLVSRKTGARTVGDILN